MASYPMPAWLRGPQGDPGAEYAAGFRLSANIAMQQQQMAQERERMGMEAEFKTQQLKQRALEAEQQIQVDKAYKDQMTALRQQQLEIAQKQVQAKTQAAAQQYAGRQKYQAAIESGMDPQDAILKFGPEMGHYASVEAAAMRASHMRKPQPAEQGTPVSMGGEDFIQIPSTTGYRYQQIHHAKAAKEAAPGTLSQVDRDELHSLERAHDKLSAAVMGDDVGQMALDRAPNSPMAQAYKRKRDQADALEKRIDSIRSRARGGESTTEKPKSGDASEKIARAKELAEEHPDWTKEQIIKAVKLEFSK